MLPGAVRYKRGMPADSLHPSYSANFPRWEIVRDTMGGSLAVKAAGTKYLPRLQDQEDAQYNVYRTRASFFAGTGRTAVALAGFLFRKPPTVKTTADQAIQDDVDMRGNSLVEYAKTVGRETSSVGRAGTCIDWSENENRPYLALYLAEDIINWRVERRRDAATRRAFMALTLLVLREAAGERAETDEFVEKPAIRYRVFRLTDEGVTVQIYTPRERTAKPDVPTAPGTGPSSGSGEDAFDSTPPVILKRRGTALNEIPFVFHNAVSAGPEIGDVPLYDLAEVNISHYRNSADLENGRHICGVPTPYALGWDSDTALYLGSSKAWVNQDASAEVGFLEMTGAGLQTLKDGLEEKERQMAALGARLIEPPKADAEAFETVALRATAETSSLSTIATQLSNSMTEVLSWLAFWTGNAARATTTLAFEVSREFNALHIDAPRLTALIAAWQQGAIHYDTLYWNLQKAEIAKPDVDAEEEREKIDADPPMPTPATNPTPPVDPNRKPPAKA